MCLIFIIYCGMLGYLSTNRHYSAIWFIFFIFYNIHTISWLFISLKKYEKRIISIGSVSIFITWLIIGVIMLSDLIN
jgi:apolipoprotein N-acyltransferase